jgi:hypothetical protein
MKQNILFTLSFLGIMSILSFQCDKNICSQIQIVDAKVDSISAKIIDANLGHANSNNLKLKDISIQINENLSILDSTKLLENCIELNAKEALKSIKIITQSDLNISYPKGSDITKLFRVIQADYTINKPYYITIENWLKVKNENSVRVLFAEDITLDAPKEFHATLYYNYSKDTFSSTTQSITILK